MQSVWTRPLFQSIADHTAVASTASEASLLAGTNQQPVLPALFWDGPQSRGRRVNIRAKGIFSTTGTPTLTFQLRLGTTAGSSYLSGTSVGVSSAITTINNSTNEWWMLEVDLVCRTPGLGTTNLTIAGSGSVRSPIGFASTYEYPIPDSATWTYTIDGSLTYYFNLSCTWSASSASNTITCKCLSVTEHG